MTAPIIKTATARKIPTFRISCEPRVVADWPKVIGSLAIIPVKIRTETPFLNPYSEMSSPSQTAKTVPAVIVITSERS